MSFCPWKQQQQLWKKILFVNQQLYLYYRPQSISVVQPAINMCTFVKCGQRLKRLWSKEKQHSQHFAWFKGEGTVTEIKFNMNRIQAVNTFNAIQHFPLFYLHLKKRTPVSKIGSHKTNSLHIFNQLLPFGFMSQGTQCRPQLQLCYTTAKWTYKKEEEEEPF